MSQTSSHYVSGRPRQRAGIAAVSALLLCLPLNASADLPRPEQDLLHGRADQAISGLRLTVAHNPADAGAHLLLCRVYLSEQHGTEAAAECQAALDAGLAGSSEAQDWAGRAFGMKAQHAGPIAGLKLAGQVRAAFQTAYGIDPHNPAAANDLGEYYVDAPFIVGGGVDKATALTNAVLNSLPEVAHRLRALIAEKEHDPHTAEREFLAAVAVARSPGSLVDLAFFYVRQQQPIKAATAAHQAIAQDRSLDPNVVDAAATLNDAHQASQAITVLRSYLDHGHQTDQAPAFRVHTMLGEILAGQGDREGARKEFGQALSLAANYAPAQKGLDSL